MISRSRTSTPARSATSTTWATTASSWSRPTASRSSTSSSPTRSRTRAGCSPRLSSFWFDRTADLLANHVLSVDPADFPAGARPDADGRAMLVRRTEPVPMECIARGDLFGSAWKEYRDRGTVQGRTMPAGMQEAEVLPEPLFTPTTKADEGHDLPMTDEEAIALAGADTFARLRDARWRSTARGGARGRGIVLADTKFEFGTTRRRAAPDRRGAGRPTRRGTGRGRLRLGRFAAELRQAVCPRPLPRIGWDNAAGAALPPEVIAGTRARYVEAYERITAARFADWYGPGPTATRVGSIRCRASPPPSTSPTSRHPRSAGRHDRPGAAGAR